MSVAFVALVALLSLLAGFVAGLSLSARLIRRVCDALFDGFTKAVEELDG